MDGISVAASIVGLLAAAAKISLGLNDFVTMVKEAPKLARTVLLEVADLSACLSQVQSLLLGVGRANASNQSLLMVEEIIVVLSNCVLVFSELEELIDGVKPDQSTQARNILKWTMKEKAVTALLLRLQSSKTSLSLMISTLTCSSIGDAQNSVSQLTDIIRQLLESNQDISERLGRMESKNLDKVSTIGRTTHNSVNEETIEDDESIVTVRQIKADLPPWETSGTKDLNLRSEFERLLESSRPYVRALKRLEPSLSATASMTQTLGLSCLSGISLAEVSNISVIGLALDKSRLWNSTHYDTGYRYLSTIAIGRKVRYFSNEPHFSIFNIGLKDWPHCCKGCGEVHISILAQYFPFPFHSNACDCNAQVVNQQELFGRSFDNNLWHIRCILCTFCSVRWDSFKTGFYELKYLTCLNCLPNCFTCGIKTATYPVLAGEKVFCPHCLWCDEVPCKVCGDAIWDRIGPGLFRGFSCFHHRNLLIQRAPHMRDFFYPADSSFTESPPAWNPLVFEDTKIKEPLRLLPSDRGTFFQQSEFLFDELLLTASIGPKRIIESNDESKSGGEDGLEIESREIEHTDSKDNQRSVVIELNSTESTRGRSLSWTDFLTNRWRDYPIGTENEPKRKSTFRTPPRLKKDGANELDCERLQISAPIVVENSLGWH